VSRLLDITPRISPRLGVWPGDTPFSREVLLDVESGDNITLSTIRTTVHLGAHTDAPNHYATGSADIADRPLDRYYGPCEVMKVAVARGQRILPADLPRSPTTERLLLRTDTFPDPEQFNTDFASLSSVLVDHLHAAGVRLVGIDTPSIDLFEDKVLESHTAVAGHDMAILEGIVLTEVPDGHYTLIALPLPIEGADASPVRAVLVVE
jgi:arylformamidase